MGRRIRYLPYDHTLVEITNRTIQGRYLLKPTKKVRAICIGALGRAQRLYDVDIHGFGFLSNHYHLLASFDDSEQMAHFTGHFQSKIAREIGRRIGWREKFWSRRYSAIPVSEEEAAQIGRLDYLLSQGVKEGLVYHPADWPGAHSVDALLYGTPLEGIWYDRTAEYRARIQRKSFDPDEFAQVETVELSPLPCWRHKTTVWIRRQVQQRVDEIVDEARTDNGRFRKLLAAVRPTDRPQRMKHSPAPWFHCASRAVRKELMRAYSEFLAAYREAAEHWLRGELTAPFPERCFPPPRPFIAS